MKNHRLVLPKPDQLTDFKIKVRSKLEQKTTIPQDPRNALHQFRVVRSATRMTNCQSTYRKPLFLPLSSICALFLFVGKCVRYESVTLCLSITASADGTIFAVETKTVEVEKYASKWSDKAVRKAENKRRRKKGLPPIPTILEPVVHGMEGGESGR